MATQKTNPSKISEVEGLEKEIATLKSRLADAYVGLLKEMEKTVSQAKKRLETLSKKAERAKKKVATIKKRKPTPAQNRALSDALSVADTLDNDLSMAREALRLSKIHATEIKAKTKAKAALDKALAKTEVQHLKKVAAAQ